MPKQSRSRKIRRPNSNGLEKRNAGFFGWLTVVSPTGNKQLILVPIRERQGAKRKIAGSKPFRIMRKTHDGERLDELRPRANALSTWSKNFSKLLQLGWRVEKQWGWHYPPESLRDAFYQDWLRGKLPAQADAEETDHAKSGEKDAKKDTDEVSNAGAGNGQKHGGNNASCEVENSQNAAENGKQRKKTRRGKRAKRNTMPMPKKSNQQKQAGKSSTSYRPRKATPVNLKVIRKSAEVLKGLIGQLSEKKVKHGTRLWPLEFLMALETGENPLPYLDSPRKVRQSRILITSDMSGSCQSWSSQSEGYAQLLAKDDSIDVHHLSNSNGWLLQPNCSMAYYCNNHSPFDFVFYLGDGDGLENCKTLAAYGVRCLIFDCAYSAHSKPELAISEKGRLFHVTGVSAHNAETWLQGLKLVAKKWQ